MEKKKSDTTDDFTFIFHFHALEKEMATHPSVLTWRISGMEEPGGLLSMGSHRVGHDWSDLAAAAAAGIGSPRSVEQWWNWWPNLYTNEMIHSALKQSKLPREGRVEGRVRAQWF